MRCYTACLVSLLLAALTGLAYGQAAPATTDSATGKSSQHSEIMPAFPVLERGDSTLSTSQRLTKFLNKDLKYPPKALRDGVGGRVFFSFTVDAQGHTTNLKLVKGVREDIDTETLRIIQRLEAIRWRPGLQDGRPVSVSFTAPLTFSVSSGKNALAAGSRGNSPADSLELGPYQKLTLPLSTWDSRRQQIPAGKGVVYGSCLQRLGGSKSFGTGEYVRIVNLTTHKAYRLNVKPIMNSRRENAFCYALPAGRYALFLYEYPDGVWGPYDIHVDNLRKPLPTTGNEDLRATRYLFVVEAGKLHYVGTWNLANQNEPAFLNEKEILDARIQADHASMKLAEATLAIPQ